MYSDLLDVLGGSNSLSGQGNRGESSKHVAVSFKAGKMDMALQENGKYWCQPDTRRGTVQLVWQDNTLKWEWLSRREGTVVDTHTPASGATFERVETPTGRVFLLSEPRTMYWMQDSSEEKDDEVVAQVNQFLTNPQDAAPSADSSGASGSGGDAATGTSTTTSNANQVDALSNILENLGMPQNTTSGAGASASTTSTTTATPAAQPTGTLTLADLQGAMAGLNTASAASATVGPPLEELVTPSVITSILENDAAKERLLQFLPEEQRSSQHLEENLRSPQVQQTLRTLTAALADGGESYLHLVANFQLDPNDGQEAQASGNPLQAFLDCIVASVEKEENKEEEKEETKEEETKDDNAMEE